MILRDNSWMHLEIVDQGQTRQKSYDNLLPKVAWNQNTMSRTWFYISTRIQNKRTKDCMLIEWVFGSFFRRKSDALPNPLPGKSQGNPRKILGKRFPKKFPENSREKCWSRKSVKKFQENSGNLEPWNSTKSPRKIPGMPSHHCIVLQQIRSCWRFSLNGATSSSDMTLKIFYLPRMAAIPSTRKTMHELVKRSSCRSIFGKPWGICIVFPLNGLHK